MGKISELFVYQNFGRIPVETVSAGDICAVCGMNDIMVGICSSCIQIISVHIYARNMIFMV
jgi:predicted membrane GTPase involved in stress response